MLFPVATLLLLVLRVLFGAYLVFTGQLVYVLYGLTALVQAFFGAWNWLFAGKQFDKGPGGYFIISWYLFSAVLIPERVPMSEAAEFYLACAVSTWLLVVIATTCWLGRAYTVGTTSVTGLVNTGPWRFCRHPLLALAIFNRLIFFIAAPTQWNLIVLVLVAIGSRALVAVEETYLLRKLSGYYDYCQWCKSIFIPGLWKWERATPNFCNRDLAEEFFEWLQLNWDSLEDSYSKIDTDLEFEDYCEAQYATSKSLEGFTSEPASELRFRPGQATASELQPEICTVGLSNTTGIQPAESPEERREVQLVEGDCTGEGGGKLLVADTILSRPAFGSFSSLPEPFQDSGQKASDDLQA